MRVEDLYSVSLADADVLMEATHLAIKQTHCSNEIEFAAVEEAVLFAAYTGQSPLQANWLAEIAVQNIDSRAGA